LTIVICYLINNILYNLFFFSCIYIHINKYIRIDPYTNRITNINRVKPSLYEYVSFNNRTLISCSRMTHLLIESSLVEPSSNKLASSSTCLYPYGWSFMYVLRFTMCSFSFLFNLRKKNWGGVRFTVWGSGASCSCQL
jgi:hypothetical protein